MCALAARILDEVHQLRRESRRLQAAVHGRHDGGCRPVRFLAAAQDADVAALEGQHRRVGGDVRAALIDDRDDAHGDGRLPDHQPVWPDDLRKDLADRVREGGDLPHAVRHGFDARLRQAQSVKHDVGDVSLRGVQILRVGRENGRGIGRQHVCHGEDRLIFFRLFQRSQLQAGRFGCVQQLLCRHV